MRTLWVYRPLARVTVEVALERWGVTVGFPRDDYGRSRAFEVQVACVSVIVHLWKIRRSTRRDRIRAI